MYGIIKFFILSFIEIEGMVIKYYVNINIKGTSPISAIWFLYLLIQVPWKMLKMTILDHCMIMAK